MTKFFSKNSDIPEQNNPEIKQNEWASGNENSPWSSSQWIEIDYELLTAKLHYWLGLLE
jgi:hypothetical protein